MGEVRVPLHQSGDPLQPAEPGLELSGDSGFDFEDFFENGGIALHLVGGDGHILHANQAELDLLGYGAENYIGRHIEEFHVDPPVIDDILARLKRGEVLRKHPARLRARDGTIKHVEITSSGRFRDGEMVNTRCFTVDVTDLHHARRALERKDEELRQLLDALPAAIYTTDAEGTLTYYNRTAAELAGRVPQVGKDKWCVTFRLFRTDGTELPLDQCPMAVTLKENRPVRGVEVVAQRPDGAVIPIVPFPTPLRDAEGNLIGGVNMLVDIGERKQAETHQRALREELNHRVRNNLQMLQSLLRGSQREMESDEAREALADIGQRLGAMAAAQQLLYGDANPRSFDIGLFLRTVSHSVCQELGGGLSLTIEAAEDDLPNDAAMPLSLILYELLSNVSKHAVDGGGRGEVTVAMALDGERAELCVEDDGPGLERRESHRRCSGLGLVEALSRQLGGSFSVERGRGARCIVRFPHKSSAAGLAVRNV